MVGIVGDECPLGRYKSFGGGTLSGGGFCVNI
jgi:hypothetical protein